MTLPVLVLADDLTGAADSAAAFGTIADTWVSFAGAEPPLGDVVAVDTDSRDLPPDKAARVVAGVLETARVVETACGVSLYKKIDSTLRGNVAAEVGAVLNTARGAFAVVAPAFPATGRTTVDGVVRVHGERLPAAHGGDLTTVLREGGISVGASDLRVVRDGPERLVTHWQRLAASGVRATVCDAETDEDLRLIQRAAESSPRPPVLVGSAGLLRVAADSAGSVARAAVPHPGEAAVLVVTGSATELNGHQVRALRERGDIAVVELRAPFGPREQAESLSRARSALPDQDVLVVPDPAEPVWAEHAESVQRSLAAVAGSLLTQCREWIGAAVLTGGATARAALSASGVRRLSVQGEMEPGVVLSTAPALADLAVVTKSGSFGDRTTLARVRQALRGHDDAGHSRPKAGEPG